MSFVFFALAAVAEIAGCFAFWAWLRLDRSPLWLAPGMASLALFGYLLTRVDSEAAGRAYASYGGIYIVASIAWLWLVEQRAPDRWDLAGSLICLIGAGVILLGPRGGYAHAPQRRRLLSNLRLGTTLSSFTVAV